MQFIYELVFQPVSIPVWFSSPSANGASTLEQYDS
jgi:hypothetical protein